MPGDTTLTLMGREVRPSRHAEQIIAEPPIQAEAETAEHRFLATLISEVVSGGRIDATLDELIRGVFSLHDGEQIQSFGDVRVVIFFKAQDAAMAACQLLVRIQEHEAHRPPEARIQLRIGIDFGPMAHLAEQLFGEALERAVQVEGLARGGQILISAESHQQLNSDFPYPCRLFDAVEWEEEVVEVFQVLWDLRLHDQEGRAIARFSPGEMLGRRFKILAPLGEGGMGQVYKAMDLALDDEVALKFIRMDLAVDPESVLRFKNEVKLTRSLTHPNICRIHEFLTKEEHIFLSMELLRGRTLGEIIAEESPMPAERALEFALGICAGLAAAHKRGIIHRDLKPSNVMVEAQSERVVLMDFGIARFVDQGSEEIMGTPEYMSPEQIQGGELSKASDVYAVGVLIYEMLTGEPPFLANNPMGVGLKHLHESPPPLENRTEGLPLFLLRAVSQALSKKPNQRFPDAESLALALGAQPPRAPRIKKRSSGLLLIIWVALLIGGGIWWGFYSEGHSWRRQRLTNDSLVEHQARWGPGGQLAFLKGGDLWLLSPDEQLQRLTRGGRATEAEELLGLSWGKAGLYFVAGVGAQAEILKVPLNGGSPKPILKAAAGVDLSPDGREIAFAEPNIHGSWSLGLAGIDGAQRHIILEGDSSRAYLSPRFSPKGKRLALVIHQKGFQDTRDIGILDLKSGKLKQLTQDGIRDKLRNTDPTWAADGRSLFYTSKRSGRQRLWRISTRGENWGKHQELNFPGEGLESHHTPDAQEEALLFHSRQVELDIESVSLPEGDHFHITRDIWPDRFPVFSPDGQMIAFRTQRSPNPASRALLLYDLHSAEETLLPSPEGLRDFAWCGERGFAFAATVGQERRLGVMDQEGMEQKILLRGFYRIWSPNCHAQEIVFVGQKQEGAARRLWLISPKQSPRALSSEGWVAFPVFSRDGRHLAYRWAPSSERLGEAELRLMEWPSGKIRSVKTPPSWLKSRRRLRFSKDGRAIYFMEAHGAGGRLWRLELESGEARAVVSLVGLTTFVFYL